MNILTPTTAAEAMGVHVKAFYRSILPLLAERGEAQQISGTWIIDGKDFWQWTTYARVRQELIEAGVWIARRPWSIRDMEDVALDLWDYEAALEAARSR